MSECRRFYLSGRVQGVFFRESARREAGKLGLAGYARNLADGRVEVLASGTPEALDRLADWLRRGPPTARVDEVRVQVVDESPAAGFDIG